MARRLFGSEWAAGSHADDKVNEIGAARAQRHACERAVGCSRTKLPCPALDSTNSQLQCPVPNGLLPFLFATGVKWTLSKRCTRLGSS
jgi:hypothetical protein